MVSKLFGVVDFNTLGWLNPHLGQLLFLVAHAGFLKDYLTIFGIKLLLPFSFLVQVDFPPVVVAVVREFSVASVFFSVNHIIFILCVRLLHVLILTFFCRLNYNFFLSNAYRFGQPKKEVATHCSTRSLGGEALNLCDYLLAEEWPDGYGVGSHALAINLYPFIFAGEMKTKSD